MKKRTRTILLFLQLIFISIPYINQAQNTQISNLSKLILNKKENIISVVQSQSGKVELETFNIDPQNKKLVLNFSSGYTYQPLRSKIIQTQKEKIKSLLGNQFKDYEIILSSMGLPVEVQVPNFYRGSSLPIDSTRLEKRKEGRIPIVKNMSNPFIPPKGLFNRNIALWHSHGWYYDIRANRWDWQRTRLFGTVEDKFTMSFILPYLVPMLENAGANVFLPRERDIQTHEVIVDADKSTDDSEVKFNEKRWTTTNVPGFAIGNPPYSHNENPFRQGTCSQSVSSKEKNSRYEWIPEFPATGDYAVYISYQSLPGSSTSALYKVHHTGGVTEFKVNQQIGGGTWIYLGTFHFEKGKNPDMGRVVLSGKTDQIGEIITADAVRFGGGMGNIARSAKDKWIENQKSSNTDPGNKVIQDVPDSLKADPIVSGRPRFLEGARYYLQYAGMPDSLIYSPEKGMNDYNDDYKSRGFWVNYLTGAPIGPTTTSPIKGLGIPIDLSFALHSDAGITPNDSIIGTLSIFSSEADSGLFYTGQSRWASRDLADIIQTQVVDDIKAKFNPNWTRRGIWNKQYSEAYRPSVPAALLELLSHQNFADMKYGNDPLFKFTVSRAIYKAMTRFIAFQNEDSCIIQPLPVSHFRVTRKSPQSVQLCWRPVVDPLEPTAKAEKYKVYTRIEDNGFDNGVIVNDTTYIISNLKPGVIYSFKIAALNEGGESFPSEILSAALGEKDDNPVLIVNAFDRVSAPATIDTPGYAGFATNLDQGVPDRYDIGYVGEQYDFDRNSTYIGNDNPGFGASYGDMETALVPGNTFDFTVIHGRAIRDAGRSYVSSSHEAFEEGLLATTSYNVIDLLLGKERTTTCSDGNIRFGIYNQPLQNELTKYTEAGGNLIISGAYVGSDLVQKKDTQALKFAEHVLHFKPLTNHAARIGQVELVSKLFGGNGNSISFNSIFNPNIYTVESPDAILPAGEGAFTISRYVENTKSAAIAYWGNYKTVVIGFPLETITDPSQLEVFFARTFRFFNKKTNPLNISK